MVKAPFLLAAGAAAIVAASAGSAAGPPPPPKAAGGQAVAVLARGVPTPTAFAFGAGQVFVAAAGDEQHPKITGGVYTLRGGQAAKFPGSPRAVFGLAFGKGTLYVSTGSAILAWSGWNGRSFKQKRVVTRGPGNFSGFNGLALGPDGRLYSGVSLGNRKTDDFQHGATSYANGFLAIDTRTGRLELIATGLRQPWQAVFVPGLRGAVVDDLSQENLGRKRPPDRIVVAVPGSDFGFPDCPAQPKSCGQYPKPFAVFPAHASPTGLGLVGKRLYVGLFGGTGKGPEVVAMSSKGGAYRPFLTGFVAPVVGVGGHAGRLYVGDLTGSIYRVTP